MTTVPHPVPSRMTQNIAALYGHEDDTLIAWQRACAQAAETLGGPHDEERRRKALQLAQDGHVTLEDDGSATVESRGRHYQVQADGRCDCPDAQHRGTTCKHALAVQMHYLASAGLRPGDDHRQAPTAARPSTASQLLARPATAWDVREAQTSACVRVRIGDLEVTYTIRGTSDDEVINRLDATLQRLRDTCEVHERRAAERAQARDAVLAQAQQTPALTPADLHTLIQQTVLQALAVQSPGGTPNGHANGHTPAQPPRCPAHGDMRESTKQPGTWFCTQKLPTGKYCPSKA